MLKISQRILCNNYSELYIANVRLHSTSEKDEGNKDSSRLKEFRKKLQQSTPLGGIIPKEAKAEKMPDNKLRAKAPLDKVEEYEEGQHPYQEKEPLEPFPNNVNPVTGEQGGPKGPEPTRFGDWERKGRVTDF